MKEIKLPEIAENVEEGTVISVLVSEGDEIKADQDILELETDKASLEVPSPSGGTVKEILVSEGDTVSVGDVIMKVEESGDEGGDDSEKDEAKGDQAAAEEAESDKAESPKNRQKKPVKHENKSEDKSEKESEKEEGKTQETSGGKPDRQGGGEKTKGGNGGGSASDVPATPATRRLAREIGVDITEVSGSGPGGRVTAADVKESSRGGKKGGGESRGGGESGGGRSDGGTRREKMTRVRSLTAERTMKSWQSIPHVTQFDEADLSGLNRYMEAAAPKVEKAGGKLTVTAVLVKLVAHALRAYPRFNAQIDMDAGEIEYQSQIAIGIAADTERGLLVPVVRDPDRKSITSLAIEIAELAKKARSGELDVSQMRAGTFSISNLGGIGGTAFTPVVVEPQVAILGVARAKTQPVHVNGRFEPREILPLSLSYDHRAIDGADGARFVTWIKTAIEDPFAALMEGEQ